MTDSMLTHDDITQPITEWALDYGIYPQVITDRLERGWTAERAITTPMVVAPRQRLSLSHLPELARYGCKPDPQIVRPSRTKQGKRLTYQGRCLSLREWSGLLGIHARTISDRLRKGLPIESVLSPVHTGRGRGVVQNFGASTGTGGGSATQDIPQIEFSK